MTKVTDGEDPNLLNSGNEGTDLLYNIAINTQDIEIPEKYSSSSDLYDNKERWGVRAIEHKV